jgi:hypothetical protein
MSKELQVSVFHLEIITKEQIKSSEEIGNLVAWFPYCQILSFNTRNSEDLARICEFMRDSNVELVTKIYKLVYNPSMISHTNLYAWDTSFEVFINKPNGNTTILKISAESFTIKWWRDMRVHGEKYLFGQEKPYYLFSSNFGIVLKGQISIEFVEINDRTTDEEFYKVPVGVGEECFEVGTKVRVYRDRVLHEYIGSDSKCRFN